MPAKNGSVHSNGTSGSDPSEVAKCKPSRSKYQRVWIFALLISAVSLSYLAFQWFSEPLNPHSTELAAANDVHNTGLSAKLPLQRGPTWDEIDDPTTDGWSTEAFHNKAKKQLKSLGKLLTHPEKASRQKVSQLVATTFSCEPLVPENISVVSDDETFKIERMTNEDSPKDENADRTNRYQGAEGLLEAIRESSSVYNAATDVRFEFKVIRVEAAPRVVKTRQLFSISGKTDQGTIERHATWDIAWSPLAGKALPRIKSIDIVDFEQVASHTSEPLFSDCTASLLGNNPAYQEQFLLGMNHWYERIQDSSYFALLGNPGLAVGDVNGDGLDDFYICQEAGLPNRLFIQNSDGTATEQSSSYGVDWLDSSRGALLVDLDNDSDQDLAVAVLGGVLVAENLGDRFVVRDVLATSDDTMSLSAIDFDQDGKLDIYCCAYYQNRRLEDSGSVALAGGAAGFVFHDANDGGANSLFRNQISADSKWGFTDVTEQVGLNTNNHRYSLAATWEDFDNDGDMDLYVANDFGRDNLYRNDTTADQPVSFVDVSEEANVENAASGMSVTWADYDRDGWMDVFVSNMFSSAGNRIAFQQQFKPDAPAEIKQRYQRLARGNTMLKNRQGTFSDESAPSGIEMGRWAWGSQFADLNNDGWEDIMVSNGYITTDDNGDL